ncbi:MULTISPECIES: hypothetical protein [unclassified Mesorhizobium]|uniref:hypothetical protein n=1 Tax=unclassified Mesorhizobium TaxID=325217 RepID=UPI000F761D82|nr:MULTISPECIES: hypothetical protein [unclassified Mesorhizobium]AZO43568.1 hypothetical protein EJ076_21975 [Mesorhizobium sp. M7D.F.Ca.US.005.01.1.1]RUX92812.1 hypothetical protein EN993_21830 [Mesorhizobium sp. M7D.F.Ca.US.004.01.2.1]RVA30931.1 hypothetical protein EN935_14320 [Mesorhizobium sp. M7D.F.Ca.US.004.03.1.1]
MSGDPNPGNPASVSSALLIAGAVLLFVGTLLHPMHEDPNDALRAFREYAADPVWLFSHMAQLAGVLSMVAGLVLILGRPSAGPLRGWALLTTVFGAASLAAAAALQAVDGIALKAVVDAWAMADAATKPSLFSAAFAVRQIEVGFAAISAMLLGLTVLLANVALRQARHSPLWLSSLGGAGAVGVLIGGFATAATGFSDTAMAANMPGSMVLLVWVVLLAVIDFRHKPVAA